MVVKIQIENLLLRGLPHDWVPQRVAPVYSDGKGSHVYAPARAKGDALDWVEQFEVRQISESGQSENDVEEQCKAAIVKQVKEHLEQQRLSAEIWNGGNDGARYYAGLICLRGTSAPVNGGQKEMHEDVETPEPPGMDLSEQ